MEKNKKKRRVVVTVAVLCICLVAGGAALFCYFSFGQKKSAPKNLSTLFTSYMKEGILSWEDSRIVYYNGATGKKNLICDNPQCLHDTSEDTECGAVVPAMVVSGLCIWEDSLYFISDLGSNKIGDCYVYRSDLNGKNRKKVGKLSANMEMISLTVYYEDDIYIVYTNSASVEDSEYESTAGVYCFHLKDGTGEVVYERTGVGAGIFGVAVDDKGVYIAETYSDVTAQEIREHESDEEYAANHSKNLIFGMDKESGKKLFSIEGLISEFYLPCVEGCFYFVQDGHTMQYQIAEKKLKQLSDQEYYAVYNTIDDMVYFRGYEKQKEVSFCFNPKSSQWKKMGEGDFRVKAIFDDYVYGLVYTEEDGYINEFIKTEDFLSGDFGKVQLFESEMEMDKS